MMKSGLYLKAKPYIRIIVFLVVFCALVELLSATYFSKENAIGFDNMYAEAMSFYNEPDNSLQVVAMGNSDLYSGFCPAILWKNLGVTSTAIGAPRQSANRTYNYLTEVLKKQNPSLVIIECDMLYEKLPEESALKSMGENFDAAFDYLDPEIFEEDVKDTFSIFLFHDRWKKKEFKDSISNKSHGYKYSSNIKKVVVSPNFMKETDKREPISPKNADDLKKIINTCKAKGIDVLLVTMPSPYSWCKERSNAIHDFANENGVNYIDFNELYTEINFDVETNFRDNGNHINYEGAIKVTNYLSNFIKENYNIKDIRDDKNSEIYKYWEKSVEEFDADVLADLEGQK